MFNWLYAYLEVFLTQLVVILKLIFSKSYFNWSWRDGRGGGCDEIYYDIIIVTTQ